MSNTNDDNSNMHRSNQNTKQYSTFSLPNPNAITKTRGEGDIQ